RILGNAVTDARAAIAEDWPKQLTLTKASNAPTKSETASPAVAKSQQKRRGGFAPAEGVSQWPSAIRLSFRLLSLRISIILSPRSPVTFTPALDLLRCA